MSGIIVGSLVFAFGLITLTQRNWISLLILAFGLGIALHGAARIAAGLVLRALEVELQKRRHLAPLDQPSAPPAARSTSAPVSPRVSLD